MASPSFQLATEWANNTVVHPVGLSALVVGVIAVAMLPRRYALVPLLVLATAVPSAQRFIVWSLDLSFIRLLIFAALLRALFAGDFRQLRLTTPDKMLFAWALWGVFAYTMLEGSFASFISRSGYMIEAAGAYMLGRVYVRNTDDAAACIAVLGIIAVPMTGLFFVEWLTGHNLFSAFGGVPEITQVRQGRMRCQGPFAHPIMAGVFWAGLLPLLAALWTRVNVRRAATITFVVASLSIIVTTSSSTPAVAVILGAAGLIGFPFRRWVPLARWGVLVVLVALSLVMTKPVWHLLARIDLVGGSTGWHRYYLIDQAIRRVDEWWLFGTTSTQHWGFGLGDVTNQFVLEGVRGGLLGLAFFSALLITTFVRIGKAMDAAPSRSVEFIYWAAGIALAVHTANFLAVSYFGQMVSLFFVLLGITVALTTQPATQRVAQPQPRLVESSAFRVLQ